MTKIKARVVFITDPKPWHWEVQLGRVWLRCKQLYNTERGVKVALRLWCRAMGYDPDIEVLD